MELLKVDRNKGNRFGARKYAKVESEDTFEKYTVVKVRTRGTRNYTYKCTCPDYLYRNHPCKHIKTFKDREIYS